MQIGRVNRFFCHLKVKVHARNFIRLSRVEKTRPGGEENGCNDTWTP